MEQPQIEGSQAPVGHHLHEPPLLHQLGPNQRRKLSDACASEQRRNDPGVIVNRKVRLKAQRDDFPTVGMRKVPAVLRQPARKCEQAVLQQVQRRLGSLVAFEYPGLANSRCR